MKPSVLGLLPLFLIACGGRGDPDGAQASSDVRIDGGETLEEDPESEHVRMCVNQEGHIFVVWLDSRDGQPDVWFNRSLDNGTSWLPTPVKVNRGDSEVFAPAIACVDNNVYIVWEDDRDGELQNHQIYFNRSSDGGETWMEQDRLLELDEDGRSMSYGPDITAVGPSVYVTWFDNANGAFDIFVAASSDFGVTWSAPVRADSDQPAGATYSAWPRIAATASGQVYVVWEDSRDGAADIYFARSENGGATFKQDKRLDLGDDPGSANSYNPRIAADGNNIYVVWHDERNGAGRDIYVQYSPNGGADWLPVAARADSDNPGFFNSTYPVVGIDGSTGHVAWQDDRNGSYDVYYRRFEFGEPGAEEVRVDTGSEPGFHNSVQAQIAVGQAGEVVIAWEDDRGTAEAETADYNDLYYNFNEGSGFAEPDLRIDSIAPGQSYKIDLNLATHGGWLFASWVDGRNGTGDVYFHALQIGEESTYVEEQAE